MKSKLLAVVLGLFISGSVWACPADIKPEGQLTYFVAGKFVGKDFGLATFSRNIQTFTPRTNSIVDRLTNNTRGIVLGDYVIKATVWQKPISPRGRLQNRIKDIFTFRGEGVKDFTSDVKSAQEMLVPLTNVKVKKAKKVAKKVNNSPV